MRFAIVFMRPIPAIACMGNRIGLLEGLSQHVFDRGISGLEQQRQQQYLLALRPHKTRLA
jgi:hypothetical protein